jgi:hypothetical protein
VGNSARFAGRGLRRRALPLGRAPASRSTESRTAVSNRGGSEEVVSVDPADARYRSLTVENCRGGAGGCALGSHAARTGAGYGACTVMDVTVAAARFLHVHPLAAPTAAVTAALSCLLIAHRCTRAHALTRSRRHLAEDSGEQDGRGGGGDATDGDGQAHLRGLRPQPFGQRSGVAAARSSPHADRPAAPLKDNLADRGTRRTRVCRWGRFGIPGRSATHMLHARHVVGECGEHADEEGGALRV